MDFQNSIGIGVAGNFAHHLEQAGELADFKDVITAETDEPKGIFPFYLPHSETFLGIYPISSSTLILPANEDAQVEPEIVLYCDLIYNTDMLVTDIKPRKFSTFNDCTIRREGAKKISHKKSWGNDSKGIAANWIDIDNFSSCGVMDNYHLCSFIKRDGVLHKYGVDAPLLGYGYLYEKLITWLIEKLNNQKNFGPLEDMAIHLKNSNYPDTALISIGATAYTNFGEHNYLKSGDEIFVISYDSKVDDDSLTQNDTKIILHQRVL